MGYIIKPIVTEKMSKLTDKSSLDKTRTKKGEKYTIPAQPKYGFIVKPEADKADIKKEVEALYGVKVLAVNVLCRQAHVALHEAGSCERPAQCLQEGNRHPQER